ncbi:MAG: Xylose isomerase-like barrel [Planctomycetaceae bacterium]|nr:Xylose isomerase-like barrel [Planctomycetaceae bacterium]
MLPDLDISRRTFLKHGVLATAALASLTNSGQAAEPTGANFGFSLYGMRKLPTKEALRVCSEIGYDSVEIVCMPDWPCAPESLSAMARQDLRGQLSHSKLTLASLMENVSPLADDKTHAAILERLKRACELGHDLVPGSTPIIETVLGGQPAMWEQVRDKMVARLQDWVKIAEAEKTIIAVKPHVGGALHTPEGAVWLMDQLKSSPWLRLGYDYSHYELRNIPLKASLESLLPRTSFIHVKDTAGTADKFQFLLPGDGRTNYVDYFQALKSAGYKGSILVEVSGQIHTRADYDPIQAAKRSYTNLAPLLERTGLRLPRA